MSPFAAPLLALVLLSSTLSPDSNTDAAIAAAVAEEFSPYVKVLSRSLYTFHCAPRRRIGLPFKGPIATDHTAVPAFLATKIERYLDPATMHSGQGLLSGLYAGPDPVVCLNFGGTGGGWAIIRITLAEGFRFVDVRRSDPPRRHEQQLPLALVEQLATAGCSTSHTFSLLTSEASPSCRRVAQAVLTELAVDGVLLNFPRTPFAGCGDAADGVFLLLDESGVGSSAVRVYTNDPPVPESASSAAERRLLRDIFLRARRLGSQRSVPWPELVEARALATDTAIRRHFLGCGDYAEDRLPMLAADASNPGEARPEGRR